MLTKSSFKFRCYPDQRPLATPNVFKSGMEYVDCESDGWVNELDTVVFSLGERKQFSIVEVSNLMRALVADKPDEIGIAKIDGNTVVRLWWD